MYKNITQQNVKEVHKKGGGVRANQTKGTEKAVGLEQFTKKQEFKEMGGVEAHRQRAKQERAGMRAGACELS